MRAFRTRQTGDPMPVHAHCASAGIRRRVVLKYAPQHLELLAVIA